MSPKEKLSKPFFLLFFFTRIAKIKNIIEIVIKYSVENNVLINNSLLTILKLSKIKINIIKNNSNKINLKKNSKTLIKIFFDPFLRFFSFCKSDDDLSNKS